MNADLKLQDKQNKTKEEQDKLTAAQNNKNTLDYGVSGASNLAPSNTKELLKDDRKPDDPDLLKRIKGDIDKLQKAGVKPTADLVYTSGSGLDPHISPEAAQAQLERVAKVRSLSADQVKSLIAKNTDGRFLGIFGEPGVNVLKLNLALDALKPS
jgi:K+-transporting ATPase ATPase C chain